VGFEDQSTDRADGNALTAILATGLTQRFIPKSGDHSPEATVSKTNGSLAQFFLADPDASTAEHAFVRVIDEQWTAGVYGQLGQDFPEPFCLDLYAEMLGYLLKFAGAIFETMGAIHRMRSQEQFQSGAG
jgi:hypothetical protein